VKRHLVSSLFLLVACAPSPVVRPSPSSDGLPAENPPAPASSDIDRACAGLAASGCPEARPKTGTCSGFVAQALGDHANLRLDCLSAATSPGAVRACGGPGYLPIRCNVH
jgi:hypothetical protein